MSISKFCSVCLIVGISLTTASCGKTIIDYAVEGDFYYVNKTTGPVKLALSGNISVGTYREYSIKPNDTLLLRTSGETIEDTTDPKGYLPAIMSDTTLVTIYDSLCYKEYGKSGSLLHNIDAYQYTKKGARHYAFVFLIDARIIAVSDRCR